MKKVKKIKQKMKKVKKVKFKNIIKKLKSWKRRWNFEKPFDVHMFTNNFWSFSSVFSVKCEILLLPSLLMKFISYFYTWWAALAFVRARLSRIATHYFCTLPSNWLVRKPEHIYSARWASAFSSPVLAFAHARLRWLSLRTWARIGKPDLYISTSPLE